MMPIDPGVLALGISTSTWMQIDIGALALSIRTST